MSKSKNKTWREVRRCGKILDRLDYYINDGVCTEFWMEYNNKYYYCSMKNGEVISFTEIDYPWSIMNV